MTPYLFCLLFLSCLPLLAQPFIPVGSIVTAEQASDQIIIFKADGDWNNTSETLWSWGPENSPEIQTNHRTWFNAPTDGKRVFNGTHLITSASGGGIALVRIEDKSTRFYAYPAGNTHSVEVLPDTNIVSVSSTGSALKLYATGNGNNPGPTTYSFDDAHGVTWDHERQLLWVIGRSELKSYTYNFDKENPALSESETFTLPTNGGHDLFPVPGENKLFYTTNCCVGTFDVITKIFENVTPIENISSVKSVSLLKETGEIIYMKPTVSWWSDEIQSTTGSTRIKTGAEFYKARWWTPNEFSYPESTTVSIDSRLQRDRKSPSIIYGDSYITIQYDETLNIKIQNINGSQLFPVFSQSDIGYIMNTHHLPKPFLLNLQYNSVSETNIIY